MRPLELFRSAGYLAANANGLVMGFVTIGLLFVYSLIFWQVQNDSAIAAGVRFLPLTIAFVLTAPLVGRLIHRAGTRLPMAVGAGLLALAALLLLRVDANTGYDALWWPFAVIGIGYGLLSTTTATAVLACVPPQRAGIASATNLTARLIGGVFGIAVLGAVLPSGHGQTFAHQFTDGLHTAMITAAAVATVGAALAASLAPSSRPTPA